ncbi:uncharacterized protein LOC113146856 [Cyclospora cayetanensis]|uniref:Uncharacterized protein LOC113146856 n=1 Tax=Cyclospora cayetanensis TaxID=88456 RepID=A0A6P6RVU8_9EIME|nr:uncharacterized protein LOC113146856 [Cyclospora cayetanensis]
MHYGTKLLREFRTAVQQLQGQMHLESSSRTASSRRLRACLVDSIYFLPALTAATATHCLLLAAHAYPIQQQKPPRDGECQQEQPGNSEDLLQLQQKTTLQLIELLFAAAVTRFSARCLRSFLAADLSVLLHALLLARRNGVAAAAAPAANELVDRTATEVQWKATAATLREVSAILVSLAALGHRTSAVYIHLTYRLTQLILDSDEEQEEHMQQEQKKLEEEQMQQREVLHRAEQFAAAGKALAAVEHLDLPAARVILFAALAAADAGPPADVSTPLQQNCKRPQPAFLRAQAVSDTAFFVSSYLRLQQQYQREHESKHSDEGSRTPPEDAASPTAGAEAAAGQPPAFLTAAEAALVARALLPHAAAAAAAGDMRGDQLCTTLRYFSTVNCASFGAAVQQQRLLLCARLLHQLLAKGPCSLPQHSLASSLQALRSLTPLLLERQHVVAGLKPKAFVLLLCVTADCAAVPAVAEGHCGDGELTEGEHEEHTFTSTKTADAAAGELSLLLQLLQALQRAPLLQQMAHAAPQVRRQQLQLLEETLQQAAAAFGICAAAGEPRCTQQQHQQQADAAQEVLLQLRQTLHRACTRLSWQQQDPRQPHRKLQLKQQTVSCL